MDNQSHAKYVRYEIAHSFSYSYRCSGWSSRMDKLFPPIIYNWCKFLIRAETEVEPCKWKLSLATNVAIVVHYNDVIMGAMASQITSLRIVYSTVYSDADQRKHRSSASLAFVRGIHQSPVNSPHKWPVTRKMFPFDDVIMILQQSYVFCSAYNSWEFQDGRILEWGIGKGGVTFTQSGTNQCFISHMYIFEQNSLYCILHGCSLDTFYWYIFMSLLITWFAILSPGP